MIDYTIILYIGLSLIVGAFGLFLFLEMDKRRTDRELFRQQQLNRSFERGKQND